MAGGAVGDSGFGAWARRYFAAKAGHDLDTLTGLFHPVIDYEDAVLCRRTSGAQRMRATYQSIFERAAASAGSSLAWSAGDERGGAVQFSNDAGLFGAPMRVAAVIELDGGRVVRQRDYWDGRAIPAGTLTGLRTQYPCHLPPADLPVGQRRPRDPVLGAAAERFRSALDAAKGLDRCLAEDAVLADLACGLEITGRSAITQFLADWPDRLPYGPGARETNVVGGARGGGWEWAAAAEFRESVGAGLTAVRLTDDGLIAALVFAWDASRLTGRDYARLPRGGARRD
jgi:ketosteroid isomerase-like protein